ncbi:MAG: GntR family transcriptional regulator [Clostridiales bacterium]|nr:GntR family transcriptional regulator [Clostridiales bacterium]
MEKSLQTESLAEQAYAILKQKIVSKQFPPGMRLIDSRLAKEFGISRTPLREAIRKLQEDGLVTTYLGKGYYVFQPTEKDIREVFEVRKMIDIAAVTKLINEILPYDKEAYGMIERIYDDFRTDFKKEGFIRADEAFHDKIVLMMDNSRLYRIYKEIQNQIRTFRKKSSADEKRIKRAFRQHEKICASILGFDIKGAIEAISEHIEASTNEAIQDIK